MKHGDDGPDKDNAKGTGQAKLPLPGCLRKWRAVVQVGALVTSARTEQSPRGRK